MAGIMRFVAALGSGYQAQDEREFQKDREKKADARAQASEDRAASADARAENERRQMTAAGAPVTVEQGAGGMTKPATADNRDVGQPGEPGQEAGGLGAGYMVSGKGFPTQEGADAAAATANSPDAIVSRQASVLRSLGKPLEATQLETSAVQGKAAKQQLEKHEQDFINEKFDQRLSQVGSAADLAEHASSITGKPVTVVNSADGKKAQLVYTNDKGEQVKYGQEFDNSAEGVQRMVVGMSKSMGMAAKVTALQHFNEFDERKKQDEWTRTHGDATLQEQKRHAGVLESQGAGHLALQGRTVSLAEQKQADDLRNDPTRVLPGGTKMAVAGLDSTIKILDTQIAQAQAQNLWDPKSAGAIDLLAQRNQAQRQRTNLLAPYLGKDGAPAAGGKPTYDQLMGGAAPAAAPAAPAGPAAAPNRNPVPVGAAAPGSITTAAQQGPTAVAAAPAVAAPAAPQVDPIAAALNPSGNPSLDAALAPRLPAIKEAAAALADAQAKVKSAAQAKDGPGVTAAVQQAQAAMNAFDGLTKDMEPGMAKRVRQAAGLM